MLRVKSQASGNASDEYDQKDHGSNDSPEE